MRLDGHVALVSGAGGAIGAKIAERLATDGANLVITDMAEEGLRRTASSIGGDPVTVVGDLSREDVAQSFIDAALEKFGKIDILVNCAGGGIIRDFLDHDAESFKATIDRNLWTCLWCCHKALPSMVERNYGRIINLGADSVRNGLWSHAGYNAAKGGMHGLTTGLAREFAPYDITVNTVAPPMVRVPIVDEEMAKGSALYQKFNDIIPKGRPAEMAEVASMIAYLASAEASFVTGQVISVNGGSTML